MALLAQKLKGIMQAAKQRQQEQTEQMGLRVTQPDPKIRAEFPHNPVRSSSSTAAKRG